MAFDLLGQVLSGNLCAPARVSGFAAEVQRQSVPLRRGGAIEFHCLAAFCLPGVSGCGPESVAGRRRAGFASRFAIAGEEQLMKQLIGTLFVLFCADPPERRRGSH